MFPSYELLGWYAVGDAPVEVADIQLHQRMCAFNEVPIFLHLRPTLAPGEWVGASALFCLCADWPLWC